MEEQLGASEVEMVHAPCPLGCHDGDELIISGRDRITHREGTYHVVRCRRCGLARTNPRPSANSIGHFYPDDYPPYQLDRVQVQESSRSIRSWLKRLLPRHTSRSRRLPPLKPGRMLEIGCASGDFLLEAANQGWEVDGLEFSSAAAERARHRGFHVFTGSLETANLPPKHYDLVVGWMVLEHLYDPASALSRLHQSVRPGGWLAISVPDFNCVGLRIFGERWHALQVPAHLIHLTPETSRALLSFAGWRVERLEHQRNISSWMISLAWWLRDAGVSSKLAGQLERYPKWPLAARIPFYPLAFFAGITGQSGRMNIWAQRIPGSPGDRPNAAAD